MRVRSVMVLLAWLGCLVGCDEEAGDEANSGRTSGGSGGATGGSGGRLSGAAGADTAGAGGSGAVTGGVGGSCTRQELTALVHFSGFEAFAGSALNVSFLNFQVNGFPILADGFDLMLHDYVECDEPVPDEAILAIAVNADMADDDSLDCELDSDWIALRGLERSNGGDFGEVTLTPESDRCVSAGTSEISPYVAQLTQVCSAAATLDCFAFCAIGAQGAADSEDPLACPAGEGGGGAGGTTNSGGVGGA